MYLIAVLTASPPAAGQARADQYGAAFRQAVSPALLRECLHQVVRELQTELESQQKAPTAQLRALSSKLGALEGSILSAGGEQLCTPVLPAAYCCPHLAVGACYGKWCMRHKQIGIAASRRTAFF